ncbi:hypothetical protein DRQ11_08185 [candidate division KSB1 bacterium]|nr:MAG: hypothetical protein DRQ11_08185 [candidate division KSB1 bacterium]
MGVYAPAAVGAGLGTAQKGLAVGAVPAKPVIAVGQLAVYGTHHLAPSPFPLLLVGVVAPKKPDEDVLVEEGRHPVKLQAGFVQGVRLEHELGLAPAHKIWRCHHGHPPVQHGRSSRDLVPAPEGVEEGLEESIHAPLPGEEGMLSIYIPVDPIRRTCRKAQVPPVHPVREGGFVPALWVGIVGVVEDRRA